MTNVWLRIKWGWLILKFQTGSQLQQQCSNDSNLWEIESIWINKCFWNLLSRRCSHIEIRTKKNRKKTFFKKGSWLCLELTLPNISQECGAWLITCSRTHLCNQENRHWVYYSNSCLLVTSRAHVVGCAFIRFCENTNRSWKTSHKIDSIYFKKI